MTEADFKWIKWLEDEIVKQRKETAELQNRVNTLESRYRAKEDPQVVLKSQAAQQQATAIALERNLYAPLRSDTRAVVDLAAFARRLLNPGDLGHAVTLEVRNAARRALGMPGVEEYDL